MPAREDMRPEPEDSYGIAKLAYDPCTINRRADVVRNAMGVPEHPLVHHEARTEVVDAFADHSKLRRVFGEQPQTGLQEGVERMVGWAREHGARSTREFTGIEISEK